MNKFSLILFFLVYVGISGGLQSMHTVQPFGSIVFQKCYDTNTALQVTETVQLLHMNGSFFSFNCNTPTVLSGSGNNNSTTDNGGSYSHVYYTITIGANQGLELTLTGGVQMEIITIPAGCGNAPVGNATDLNMCMPGTYVIRVFSPSNALTPFTLNYSTYNFSTTINISENSGVANNDGILCTGAALTLNSNVTINAPAVVSTYNWQGPGGVSGAGSSVNVASVTTANTGTYFLTVTDDNGCTATASVNITVNPNPTGSIAVAETSGTTPNDAIICAGASASLTASGGSTYQWSTGQGGANISVSPGSTTTYTVTVTDSNGCTNSTQQTITVNPLPNATISVSETSGTANNDGSICQGAAVSLTGAGGNSYAWNTGDMTATINPSPALGTTTYTVTVTDVNGCTQSSQRTITVNPLPIPGLTVTETSGLVNNDGILCQNGQATLTATGGTTYTWSSGNNGAVVTLTPPLGMTTYTVTVSDANGCTATTQTTVTVNPLPTAVINVTDNSAATPNDGEICLGDNATLTASGGTSYAWSNGTMGSTNTVSPSPAGMYTYTVTVTDANGCTDTETSVVTVLAIPMPTITIAETSGTANNDGILCTGDALTLTAMDGSPTTTFTWTLPDGSTSMTNPFNLARVDLTHNGVFTVTANNRGCTAVATVNITVNEKPTGVQIIYDGSPNDFQVCEQEAFSMDVQIGMGTGPYTYTWTLPNGSTASGSPYSVSSANANMHSGTWVVTVTSANGCTGTDNISVTVNPNPTNDNCGSALNLGSGTNPITATGNNVCATPGGGCGTNSENAVYFTYTVPTTGLTRLTVAIGAPFVVSVGPACGSGGCSNNEVIECPDKGATYYITVSSSEANAGNYSLTVTPLIETPPINGTIYIDLNANSAFDGSDIGLGSTEVQLLEGCPGGNVVATTTTADGGTYSFMNIPPGFYTVQVGPNGPDGTPNPANCCLEVDPCSTAPLMCDMGYPPPNCTSNPYSADNICDDAIPLCNLSVIGQFPCSQNPSEFGPWLNSAHCGGVYHNTSFYKFVAGSGNYSIQFTIFNCAGTGVQYAIMEECNPGGPFVVCDGGANTGTVTVSSDQLEECKTYIFWIDGWAGSVCSYYVQVVGQFNECEIPPVEDIVLSTDCDPICPSQSPITIQALGPGGIQLNIKDMLYKWEITTPFGSLNFDSEVNSTSVPFLVSGTYTMCVSTYHPCPGQTPFFCKTVVVEDLTDYDFGIFDVCKFPWEGPVDQFGNPILDKYGNPWLGGEITLAMANNGQIIRRVTDDCNCYYNQYIRVRPTQPARGIVNLPICQSQVPFDYNGLTINSNLNNFEYLLPNILSSKGCDSIVTINARILNIGGRIIDDCTANGFQLSFEIGLPFLNADRDSLEFIWRDAGGTIIPDLDQDSTNIIVPTPGNYTLEIRVYKYGRFCSFNFNHTLDLAGRLPSAPLADNWPLKICENNNQATYNVLTPDPGLTYIWTYPATATLVSESPGTLVLRWNGPVGGDVCVKSRNLCGDGPNTCLPVVYIDQMDPAFTMAVDVCKDQTTPLVATSTHIANTTYNWNFDGGVSSNTNGTGPGPHNVSWNASGVKTVTLSVTEEGCTGDPVSRQIDVKDPPPPPVISCVNSTINSVTFEWPPVPGATGYTVAIVSGVGTGSITGPTQYTVTGMSLGATVEVVLTAIIPGPCGNAVSAPVQCTASNCVLPVITINPISPICLTATTPAITLDNTNVTIVPATVGVGEWIINGVASPSGVFDPKVLGPGSHTIGYNFVFDNGLCRQSASPITVVVNPTPTSDFTIDRPTSCILDSVVVTYTGGTTGAVYTWNFGPDVIGTYNGPGPHNVKWMNAGQKTITLTVTRNGCTSPVTTRQVQINPVLAAPTVYCADQKIDAVTFGWNTVANASGYQVWINGVLVTTQTTTMYTVSGLNEKDKVTIRVVAVSTNGCPNSSATHECEATACPATRLNFPARVVPAICLTSTAAPVPLTFTVVNPPVGIPVITWSGNGVNNVNQTFDPKVAGVGQHIVKLTYEVNTCITVDSILFTVKLQPVALFTSVDKICVSDPLLVTYTGTPGVSRPLVWNAGTAVKTDLTINTFNFNWATAGTYNIGLTVELDGCISDPFSKSVVVEGIPTPPVITCKETLNSIEYTWNAIPCATEYNIKINGVSKGKQTTTSYTASGLMEGENVEITVEAISTCACPIPPASLICKAKACPPVVINLTPAQSQICLTPNLTTKIKIDAVVTGNTAGGKGTWSPAGKVDQNGNFDPVAAGLGTHIITYAYVDETCDFSKTTTIRVTEVPRIIWEAIQPKCYNDNSGSFLFTIEGGTAPYTLQMDGRAVTGPKVDGVTAGNHTFTVTDAEGCSSSQQFTITIPAQPDFDITGLALVNLGREATHTLDLTKMAGFNIDSIVWVRAGVVICAGKNCLSVTNIPPIGQNEYEVTVFYNNGCKVSDRFAYLVTDLYITTFPNIININSKSGNNVFKITTSDPSLWVKSMRIYDRWGNLVFIEKEFSAFTNPKGWNGRFDGRDVVPGVYVYIFEMKSDNEDEIVESGDVTVIK